MLPVSVIIPCFNAASTLARALESCLAQPEAAEIIVVDDGSTDDSRQIAAHYASRDPRVKPLSLNQNSGAARARNWAAMHAECAVLAFLDADDEYLPDALYDATAFFASHPQNASIRLNIEFCGFPDEVSQHPALDKLGEKLVCTVPSSLVIRRSVYMALGGFPADELLRTAGGEDMPLSRALSLLYGNPRLSGRKGVRMHYHPGIHAQKFFSINMGFGTDPHPESTAQVHDLQLRLAQRAVASVEELRGLRPFSRPS
ncbi:glycosyltransferase family 2 protein [Caballeronia sp. BR00000012568055]|uniref:glycosyltransferase family 2 protein n=1 Tax=Caballeronia sp. BR00000012568055 TaxID=2918761 RepID=UPI0023F71C4B|nr:glycosyltransferase family 2 protein [Caballeronia sp. BR00000012568055]